MEQARPLCRGCGQKVLTEIEAIEYDGDGRPWHHFCMEESVAEYDPDRNYDPEDMIDMGK